MQARVVLPGVPDFQYPRSDRRRCNDVQARVVLPGVPDFQYPRSDRRRCNVGELDTHLLNRGGLSVSSVGSEAMQLETVLAGAVPEIPFQYPRSDRRRCN